MTQFWGQKIYARGPKETCSKMRAKIWSIQNFEKEFLMSHRQMAKYWNDYHDGVFGPLSCYSRLLEMKRRPDRFRHSKIFIRRVTHI